MCDEGLEFTCRQQKNTADVSFFVHPSLPSNLLFSLVVLGAEVLTFCIRAKIDKIKLQKGSRKKIRSERLLNLSS